MLRRLLGLVFIGTVSIGAGDALGSIVPPVSYVQMICWFNGDSLVRARVLDSEALYVTRNFVDDWGRKSESREIFTRYRLSREQLIHGDSVARQLDLYLPGGRVGDRVTAVSASYELEPGWEITLFLQWDALNRLYYSAGTAQTVFVVLDEGERDLLVNLRDYQQGNIEKLRDLPVQGRVDLDEPIWKRDGRSIVYSDLVGAFDDWPGCPPDSIADEANHAPW